jgi:membrane protein DedA with SNARE-associated domain
MGLTIYLGNALGKWLDQKYQLQYLETTLTLFAIFASMYLVIAQVIQTSKDDE